MAENSDAYRQCPWSTDKGFPVLMDVLQQKSLFEIISLCLGLVCPLANIGQLDTGRG